MRFQQDMTKGLAGTAGWQNHQGAAEIALGTAWTCLSQISGQMGQEIFFDGAAMDLKRQVLPPIKDGKTSKTVPPGGICF